MPPLGGMWTTNGFILTSREAGDSKVEEPAWTRSGEACPPPFVAGTFSLGVHLVEGVRSSPKPLTPFIRAAHTEPRPPKPCLLIAPSGRLGCRGVYDFWGDTNTQTPVRHYVTRMMFHFRRSVHRAQTTCPVWCQDARTACWPTDNTQRAERRSRQTGARTLSVGKEGRQTEGRRSASTRALTGRPASLGMGGLHHTGNCCKHGRPAAKLPGSANPR